MTIEERSTARAIQDIAKEMKKTPKIDWEQRRYEIAKDAMSAIIIGGYKSYWDKDEDVARYAVRYADALIAKLKEWKE